MQTAFLLLKENVACISDDLTFPAGNTFWYPNVPCVGFGQKDFSAEEVSFNIARVSLNGSGCGVTFQ